MWVRWIRFILSLDLTFVPCPILYCRCCCCEYPWTFWVNKCVLLWHHLAFFFVFILFVNNCSWCTLNFDWFHFVFYLFSSYNLIFHFILLICNNSILVIGILLFFSFCFCFAFALPQYFCLSALNKFFEIYEYSNNIVLYHAHIHTFNFLLWYFIEKKRIKNNSSVVSQSSFLFFSCSHN